MRTQLFALFAVTLAVPARALPVHEFLPHLKTALPASYDREFRHGSPPDRHSVEAGETVFASTVAAGRTVFVKSGGKLVLTESPEEGGHVELQPPRADGEASTVHIVSAAQNGGRGIVLKLLGLGGGPHVVQLIEREDANWKMNARAHVPTDKAVRFPPRKAE